MASRPGVGVGTRVSDSSHRIEHPSLPFPAVCTEACHQLTARARKSQTRELKPKPAPSHSAPGRATPPGRYHPACSVPAAAHLQTVHTVPGPHSPLHKVQTSGPSVSRIAAAACPAPAVQGRSVTGFQVSEEQRVHFSMQKVCRETGGGRGEKTGFLMIIPEKCFSPEPYIIVK